MFSRPERGSQLQPKHADLVFGGVSFDRSLVDASYNPSSHLHSLHGYDVSQELGGSYTPVELSARG